ncbi:MAG: substrate-binding domain-containing protein [Bacteroidetes bacterium]|nr:substrate-binding domain-containing protein [Bacteroidota bacterium]
MRSKLWLYMAFISAIAFQSCKRKAPVKSFNDTYYSGSLVFAADETFAPILDQELYIFKNDHPGAKPIMRYRSEGDVVRLLMADSTRFVFLPRELTSEEVRQLRDRNLPPSVDKFAVDAVAIIVNQASQDTATSVNEIKGMLRGQAKTDRSIVFDNPNSSLVRFLKEFTGLQEFRQKNIYALKSDKEVIEYVSAHPNAIGIVGYNWLNDPDADYAEAAKKVRILAVKDENSKTAPNQYFRPSQETLSLKEYPLRRNLYVVNCTGRKGLGEGFQQFIESDKGQRIVLRSGLLPVLIQERIIMIHSNKL